MTTFGSPQIITGTPVRDAEAPHLAVSDKHVYVVWHEKPTPTNDFHEVWIAHSKNRGAGFDPRLNVSTAPDHDSTNRNSDGEAVAARDDRVFVAWVEEDAIDGTVIRLRRSGNNGAGFGSTKRLSTQPNALAPVVAAADGGHVWVAWIGDGAVDPRVVYVAHSGDNAQTFDKEVAVSSGSEPTDLTIAASGSRAVIAWRQDTPGGGFEVHTVQAGP